MNRLFDKMNNMGAKTESLFSSSSDCNIYDYNNRFVHILEKIKIGNIDQAVLIRGKSAGNPILLVLHGGPGCSVMGLVSNYNRSLEDHFLVVNWDQRGTCKSFFPQEKIKDSMNIGQFVADACELIEYLKKKFNQEKIFLLGHSWGSVIGTIIAEKHPELLHAYISTGQIVNLKESEKIAMKFIVKNAEETRNNQAIMELSTIQKIKPHHGDVFLERVGIIIKWVHKFGGAMYREKGIEKFKKIIVCSEYYNFNDLMNYRRGWEFSVKALWREMLGVNFFSQVKKIDVPVYFIHGKHDYQTPLAIVKKYFKKLRAGKKELIVFENSAHHPLFEEPEKFNKILAEKVLYECIKI